MKVALPIVCDLNEADGKATLTNLPKVGPIGNSHLLTMQSGTIGIDGLFIHRINESRGALLRPVTA